MNHWINKRIQRVVATQLTTQLTTQLEAYVQSKMGLEWEDLSEQELYAFLEPNVPSKFTLMVNIDCEKKSFRVGVWFGLIMWICTVTFDK